MSLETIRGLLLLALGFGFVVFWHELGHFLAAKWAGVKVEQFAVGFGQAVLAWRKGLGMRFGSTTGEFKRRIREHLGGGSGGTGRAPGAADDDPDLTEMDIARGAKALGISETEYRLNWLPLGGYVKMLGQDDLRPNSEADDPRAFNRQTVGKRMVIVSAGVVMNVILAAIGFMALFLYGFKVPPAQVGTIVPLSPAQQAGMQIGDRIVSLAGKKMYSDWTKVELGTALADPSEPTAIEIERDVDGKPQRLTLQVTPKMGSGAAKDVLRLGIGAAYDLRAVGDKRFVQEFEKKKDELAKSLSPEVLALRPGDVVTKINDQPVDVGNFQAFDAALQASKGRPVRLTVRGDDGKGPERVIEARPRFLTPFGQDAPSFAGMLPRVQVEQVLEGSPAAGPGENGLKPGDVIESITTGRERNRVDSPTVEQFQKQINDAGQRDLPIEVDVLRGDAEWTVTKLRTQKINAEGRQGLGIGIGYETGRPVVAATVKESAAAKANIPSGARIVQVGGQSVANWSDVHTRMLQWLDAHPSATPVPVTYVTAAGETQTQPLAVSAAEADALRAYRYMVDFSVPFDQPRKAVRKADGPAQALGWGLTETWDFIQQFYLTLHRMVTGGVSAKNLMGPVGIFQAGTGFATKGTDWLIWFLAMISANLAVVNFLPIPIVDGGLFTFLILEKLKGKPLSAKAQTIAQYVGLALLLGIFLFVTYQDVINFQFRGR